MVNVLPFTEIKKTNSLLVRKFDKDISEQELKWHWDEEDRIIRPLKETNWKFQFDNCLPQNIEGEIKINKGEWHRLIKGSGDLEIEIQKLK